MTNISVDTLGFASDWFCPALMRQPHRHNEVEINFVEAGSLTYLFGGMHMHVRAGQLVIFWATIPHQIMQVEESSVLHWVTIPFASFLQWRLPDMLTRRVVRGNFVLGRQEQGYQLHQHLFRQWYADLQSASSEHRTIVLLEVEACLRRFALSFPATNIPFTEDTNVVVPSNELNSVERIAVFIADHYTEAITVEQIARQVHLHPNYVMSLFRKSFGISIGDYITQYRISHAQRLLVTTTMNVSEIALDAGFGSVSRFYSAFKQVCEVSPRAYRTALHFPL
jgi:AraC-like DNA-binding protein